jgi:SAM-dependent methyltransferase
LRDDTARNRSYGMPGALQSPCHLRRSRASAIASRETPISAEYRYLAATHRCTVLGVDLSPDFIDAAKYLSERSGLTDLTDFRVGDALNLPSHQS